MGLVNLARLGLIQNESQAPTASNVRLRQLLAGFPIHRDRPDF